MKFYKLDSKAMEIVQTKIAEMKDEDIDKMDSLDGSSPVSVNPTPTAN